MFFLLAWLRHHIILHTLYWICSITFRGWRRNISTHLRYFALILRQSLDHTSTHQGLVDSHSHQQDLFRQCLLHHIR
jgi:hypothetical protein